MLIEIHHLGIVRMMTHHENNNKWLTDISWNDPTFGRNIIFSQNVFNLMTADKHNIFFCE